MKIGKKLLLKALRREMVTVEERRKLIEMNKQIQTEEAIKMNKQTSITLLEVQSRHYDRVSMWNQTHDRLMLNRVLADEELKKVEKYFKDDHESKQYFDIFTVEELKEHYKKSNEERGRIYADWKHERTRRIEKYFKEEFDIYCCVVDYDQTVEIYNMYEWD